MLSSLNIPRDGVSIMYVCDCNGNWQLEGILKSALTQKKTLMIICGRDYLHLVDWCV